MFKSAMIASMYILNIANVVKKCGSCKFLSVFKVKNAIFNYFHAKTSGYTDKFTIFALLIKCK